MRARGSLRTTTISRLHVHTQINHILWRWWALVHKVKVWKRTTSAQEASEKERAFLWLFFLATCRTSDIGSTRYFYGSAAQPSIHGLPYGIDHRAINCIPPSSVSRSSSVVVVARAATARGHVPRATRLSIHQSRAKTIIHHHPPLVLVLGLDRIREHLLKPTEVNGP